MLSTKRKIVLCLITNDIQSLLGYSACSFAIWDYQKFSYKKMLGLFTGQQFTQNTYFAVRLFDTKHLLLSHFFFQEDLIL